MERLEFENIEDLIICSYSCLESIKASYPSIAIYGKYEIIKEVLREFIFYGASITSIDLEDYETDFYDKEYVLYLLRDEEINTITVSVEKTWNNETGYLGDGGDISFVHDECNSKLLKYIDSDIVYEFAIDNDDRIDIDCCNCDDEDCLDRCARKSDKSEKYVEYSKDSNGNMHGFSASKSDGNTFSAYSFYSTDKLSPKDIQTLLQEAGF